MQPTGQPAATAAAGQFCTQCGRPVHAGGMTNQAGSLICQACAMAPARGTTQYGGFWIRLLARVIDRLIIGAGVMVIGFVQAGRLLFNFGDPWAWFETIAAVAFYGWLLAGAYEIGFVAMQGATPGKRILNLRIVRADGQPLSWGVATGRYFAVHLSALIMGLGFLIAVFDDRKRALHDMICGTLVVRT